MFNKLFWQNHICSCIQASSIQSQSFVIKYENYNVKALLPESNVNIQLTLQGMKLASIYDKTKCFVTPKTISGCYNCLSGANFQYDCKTEGRQSSIAYVNCSDSISFAIPCNNQEDSIRISINRAEVATSCTVSCPAGQTSFNLTGTLGYVAQGTLIDHISAKSSETGKNDGIDFSYLWNFFALPRRLMIIVFTFIVSVLMLFLLLKAYLIFSIYSSCLNLFGFRRMYCRRHDKII